MRRRRAHRRIHPRIPAIALIAMLCTGPVALAAVAPGPSALAAVAASRGPQAEPTATASPARPAATTLRLGSRGAQVRVLQSMLAQLTYLPRSAVDGVFGTGTWHAVAAFQGWTGLARDGVVGARTRAALARAHRPVPWSRATGFEVHIPQQVLLLVSGGRVQRAVHVSTGSGGRTPLGHFRIYRRERLSWSVPFHVWMPLAQYFSGGYAMHEFYPVPAYPASHGCVRVPSTDSQQVWRFGAIGMRLWTRR